MSPRRPGRLARRLLGSHLLVVVAGTVVSGVVITLWGPLLLRDRAVAILGPERGPEATLALTESFVAALTSAVAGATVVALITAIVVSFTLAVRIARPVERLAGAARAIGAGDTSARAPRPGADDELLDLTDAFNAMAAGIERTETVRRQLLSDLSHELRTPLSMIEGYLEGVRDGVVPVDDDLFAVITDATRRLHRLVDDVGELSRAEEGALELRLRPVELTEVVRSVVAALEPSYRAAEVALDLRVDRRLDTTVTADADRVAQIVTNLLTNARTHGAGGRVTVTVEATSRETSVTVTDDGIGISPDDLPHVFDRFFRGDRARHQPGSGLGLTIARSLARAQGGDLRVASAGQGGGATFTLLLRR